MRIFTGQDTEPGPTIFQVFSTTLEKLHDPIFAPIDFEVDIDARQARLVLQGVTEGRGEPIKNPVTGGRVSRALDITYGFEYSLAEMGRGWTTVSRPFQMSFAESYGQFAHFNLNQSGVIK